MKPKAVICDLDNTLCDASHRMPLFEAGKFLDFETHIIGDEPNHVVGQILQSLRFRGYKILFVSGRREATRGATVSWLREYFPGFDQFPIFLRQDQDERADFECKRQVYYDLIKDNYEVVLVLEDRRSVVDMWRREGLQCWQVAEGDY